jgi:hypothetical protein
VTAERSAGVALLLLFLLAHLVFLPRTLEDLDSINFALGVRQFDVARHQPHPPGYPVFIGLGKLSTAALRSAGLDAASSRGLAVWSAIGGAAAIPALLIFFRRLEGRRSLALWATVLVALSPLYWFTSLRPLSDMAGFAAAIWAIALVSGTPSRRVLVGGALLAGLAVGIRTQTAMLTFPFLAFATARRRDAGAAVSVVIALAAGGLAWAVPLLVASGGPSGYLAALSFQADADLSGGIVNLWTHHAPRDIVQAVLNSFVWPWDRWPGIAISLLAAIGALRLMWRAMPAALTLFVAFVPYAVFHLLFHETETTRYALPLLPLMAYAAMAALEGLPARAMPAAAIGVGVLSLLVAMPAARLYAREGAPAFRAFDEMAATSHGGERVDAIGFHAAFRRAVEWSEQILPATAAKAPHGREWLALVALWQGKPNARVWFAADPKRTDLALFDPRTRDLIRSYRWGFIEPPFVGGARPGSVDWYSMPPPNWMLDRGWSVTAEVAGITATDRLGPHAAPAVAWLKRQAGANEVLIGGRNIGSTPGTLALALNGTRVHAVAIAPGFFLSRFTLPAGALAAGAGYQPLEVTSTGAQVVSLEQFDAQPDGVPMAAFDTGWHEPEYSPSTGVAWRWMTERADLWVRPIGARERPHTLTIAGESPLRYFDAAPHVRVTIGGKEIAAFDPATDFEQTITLPPEVLAAAGGRVTLETTKFFVPADRGEGADRRHLALRIYRVHVE